MNNLEMVCCGYIDMTMSIKLVRDEIIGLPKTLTRLRTRKPRLDPVSQVVPI